MCSREFHAAVGPLIDVHRGTVPHFAGDGVLVFFNDPLPSDDPCGDAARMALEMQANFVPLAARWRKLGHDLGLGIGVARGYATLGAVGYEGRVDYSAIGSVVNLAARLCGEAAGGQVLVDRRAAAALEDRFVLEALRAAHAEGLREAGGGISPRRRTGRRVSAHGAHSDVRRTCYPTSGLRQGSPGKRPKSRSAVHSSRTPCAAHSAAIRASCTAGPEIRPSRTSERSSGQ